MDYVRAIRLLALQDVLRDQPTLEYAIGKMQRWYSKQFYTPLAQVEEMDLDRLMRIYYIEKYEEWREADKKEEDGIATRVEDEIEFLTQTDEERERATLAAAREKTEEWQTIEEARSIREKQLAENPGAPSVLDRGASGPMAAFKGLGAEVELPSMGGNQVNLRPMEVPQDLKIEFIDLAELEALERGDGLGPLIKP